MACTPCPSSLGAGLDILEKSLLGGGGGVRNRNLYFGGGGSGGGYIVCESVSILKRYLKNASVKFRKKYLFQWWYVASVWNTLLFF